LLQKLKDKLKYEQDNILFYNYHYKYKKCNSKGAYCYIISPDGAKKILHKIYTYGLVPSDYLFTEYKFLNVKTTSKTIFRINSKYKPGLYSSTMTNYENTTLKPKK
jgi:GR25 family glycosyltransferase involved in LPS biosynthesis